MIEGFKVRMTSDELRDHLSGRADYHAEKRDWYEATAKEAGERVDAVDQFVSNNPQQSLKASADSHRRKSAYFTLLSKHVVPNETYQLDESELTRLELVDRYL